MKMKIILVIIFFSLILFISYMQSKKIDINYTIIGDETIFTNNIISKNFADLIYDKLKETNDFGFYSKDFISGDVRIVDLINDIKENKTSNGLVIQNIINRTDLLIISIGNNEIYYKLSKVDINQNNDNIIYSYLDDVVNDLDNLITLIKKYNDKNIIFLGYYNDTGNINNNKYYSYINKRAENIMNKNDIYFINTFNILNKNNDYLTQSNPVYITNDGNMAIFNKLYSKIDELYLHKQN